MLTSCMPSQVRLQILSYSGTLTLRNTIVANSGEIGNCYGTITDGGGNLSYPDTTCPGINSDPALGPLQDNGGPTYTMALLPGSAALDAANDVICAAAPVNNSTSAASSVPWEHIVTSARMKRCLQAFFCP
jgi:hypothetical protein